MKRKFIFCLLLCIGVATAFGQKSEDLLISDSNKEKSSCPITRKTIFDILDLP